MANLTNLGDELKKLFSKAGSFIQQNPTPASFIGKQIPQQIKQPIQKNLGRLRNIDIASTAAGGAMKAYNDTQQLPFYNPRRVVAQNFPVVGAVKNIVSQKPTFASEQIQRAVPGTAGSVLGFGAELLLPGIGGELKAGKGLVGLAKNIAKQAPRAIISGAGEATSFSQIPQYAGTNLLLAGGLSAIAPIANKLNPNAKGFDMGRNKFSRWMKDDVYKFEEVRDTLSQNKKLTDELTDKLDKDITYLARAYLPTSTIEKVARDYGSNSRGFIKAVSQELEKSLKGFENRTGAFQMGITQAKEGLQENKSGIKQPTLATSSKVVDPLNGRIASPIQQTQPLQSTSLLQGQQIKTSNPSQKAQSGSLDEILQQAKQEIQKQPDKKQSIKSAFDTFYTDYVNRMQPVENLVQGVEKSMKAQIRPEFNPKYQIMKLLGAGGTAELRHRKELDPIIKELGNVDKSDFDVFLKASRDLELGQRGILGSNSEIAQQRIQALGNKYDLNQFKNIATKLYDYQDKGLQKLVQAGFIDDTTYKTIKGQNEAYVPFQRVMDEVDSYLGIPTKKLSQGKQPINKIVGSERAILSPLESIIANTYKLEGAIAKNNVAKSIANLSTINPDLGQIIRKVTTATKDTIPVWEGGKKVFYEVPEDINRVVKGLNEEQAGQVVKLLSIPANLLRQGATGRNVDFMLPNVVKDQFDAAISSKYGYRPFIDYFNGLGEMVKSKMGKPNLYEEYAKSGGKIFYEMAGGRKAIAKEITDATRKKNIGQKFFSTVTDGLDFLGKVSETPTRVGLFKRALQGSGNKLIAAQEAREGTLDFARMGAKMKVANSIIPFLNVGVQGFDKLIRNAKENPGKMLFYGTIYGIAPQVALTVWNNTHHPQEYQEIPDDIKQDNFVLVTGRSPEGKVQYVTLSKGNVMPYITNPVDNILSAAAGYDRQSFATLATTLLGDALPLIEPGRDLGQTASRSLGSVIPQAFKPAVENVANFNFYKGKEIVPWYMKNKVPAEQTYDSTELPYKYIGNLIQVSPLKVKNILEGYLSGFVKTPLQIGSILQKISRGDSPSPNEVPILRRFISETYDTGEDYQEKQLKAQEQADTNKETQATIAPIEKRLFGQVSAAETEAESLKKKDLASREKLRKSKETKLIDNGKVYIKKDTESGVSIDTIDPKYQPSPPKFTGQEDLDKQIREKFNGEITKKANDIYKLYEEGELTQDEANTELAKLKELKAEYAAPKKGRSLKNITFKKVTAKPIKVSMPKQRKMATIKLSKPPKPKKPKIKGIKAYKTTTVKPFKTVKLKGLEAGVKLV